MHSRDFLDVSTKSQRDIREGIKRTIANTNFVGNLKKAVYILKEIDRLTTKFQGDNVPISEVYAEFLTLPSYFDSEMARECLKNDETQFIKNKIKVRKVFIIDVLNHVHEIIVF